MNDDFSGWLTFVREKAKTLRYGVVQIVIHDSNVTQIECTEKTRIENSGAAENRRARINQSFTRPDKLEATITH